MTTPLKRLPIRPSKAPNLPIAPVKYAQQYLDQFANALRLYFNEIDNFTGPLLTAGGGGYLQFPSIAAAYVDTGSGWNQYATAANTPTIVQWNEASFASGFILNVGNTATVEFPGIYKITYSIQFANSDNTSEIDAPVWLQINGTDVPSSTTIFTVPKAKSGTVNSYICGYSEVVFELAAGDEIGLWWGTATPATSGGAKGVYLHGQAAQTTPMAYPSTPSVIGSITFVSATTA